jgi:hypothetical protein
MWRVYSNPDSHGEQKKEGNIACYDCIISIILDWDVKP